MKKNIIFVIFISVITFIAPLVTSQSPTPSDLAEGIVTECVTFTPVKGFGRKPDAVEQGTFIGKCSGKTKCDIVIRLPSGEYVPGTEIVKLDSGNNFFSPGEINEQGQMINVLDHAEYYLYAAHTPEPLGAGADGENTTQQQAQATLVFPAGAESCTQIYWDPYGRIFDSVSLEPFEEGMATVTLLDENGNISLNTFANNVSIDKMGKYNILINRDGRYKLRVTPKTNHAFTAAIPDLRYLDLYEFIYKLGDPAFVETVGNPKRVDVGLKPIGTPYSRSPDYISREYIDVWWEGAAFTKIALRTVHPKTIVKVMVNGFELTEDGEGRPLPKTSDKEGYWLALIKKEVLSQEGFTVELIKNPQYYPLARSNTSFFGKLLDKVISLFVKGVSAQQSIRINPVEPTTKPLSSGTTVIKFEPILDYVEGFSYDDSNKIVPNAKVNVKIRANNKIFYTTTADDSGFFTIYPKNLPPYEFYLEVVDPTTGKILKQTTSEFVEINQSYLKAEKIDLLKGTKYSQKVVDPVTGELNKIDKNYVPPTQDSRVTDVNTKDASSKAPINPTILIIASVIVLLIVVTVGLALYIKKSKSVVQ